MDKASVPELLPKPLSEEEKVLTSFFLNLPSPLTAKEYKLAASEFFELVSSDIQSTKDLRRHHIILYRRWLEERRLANKTIQKKIAAISSLTKFLAEAGLVERDLSYGVQRPKTENRQETGEFSDEEIKSLFSALDPAHRSFPLHLALLALGFYTGLRSSEIRNLRIKNLGQVQGVRILRLQIKGDKVHEIPLHPFAIQALEGQMEYLKLRGKTLDDPEELIFPGRHAKRPITCEALNYILKKTMQRAGIKPSDFRRHSAHSMRASFAGHLLNTVGARLEDVQAALGHATPSTTQRYNKRKHGHEKSPVFKIEF